jgi:serine/threonine protein kinase
LQRLPPDTQVGQWRVEAWQGQGAYGAVYRAVSVGQEHAGPVALKLSLLPWNERLVREAELLSLLSHPSIPRLLDRGELLHPASIGEHPFFVMEWVEGTPLYAWAKQHAPTGQQVCLLLAQLARALEALHAAGAVHRDLKGDNVLVRLSDRLPVLIDFGSAHFQGAKRLTWQSLAPGTPGYLPPQAWLFCISLERDRDAYYSPSPADDLFALGVTAYRLVMGEYPPDLDARQQESGTWHVSSPDPRPLLENNPRVTPLLREVILRLLSDAPEARGTAAQAAAQLETAAEERSAAPRPAEAPGTSEIAPPNVAVPIGMSKLPQRTNFQARKQTLKPWLVLAAAGVLGVMLWGTPQLVPVTHEDASANMAQASDAQTPDASTAAMGGSSPPKPQASTQPPSEKKPVAQDSPPEPRPGQMRPDKRGSCPGRTQVRINGGCWMAIPSATAEECKESGYLLLKGKCYAPTLEPPQKSVPTSSPPEAR